MTDDKKYIPVNQALNLTPQLGPIPGDQVIPWGVILLGSFLIGQGLFGWDWTTVLFVGAWGCCTWWCLTGKESWRFLSKFKSPPYWVRGHLSYRALMPQEEVDDA